MWRAGQGAELNGVCSGKKRGKSAHKSMCCCTRPRLGMVSCQRLAAAFHLTSPHLLPLISFILPPVLLFPWWHRHLKAYLSQFQTCWVEGGADKGLNSDHTLTSVNCTSCRYIHILWWTLACFVYQDTLVGCWAITHDAFRFFSSVSQLLDKNRSTF